MKKYILSAVLFVGLLSAGLLQGRYPPMDQSPMDMSYYPATYPILKIQKKITDPLMARVVYSRPQKNGRIIFGELREYGKLWRLGANEATEIEFFGNVKIGGKKIKKGRYTMYAIPYINKWTIILNSETDTWGDFAYDSTKDIVRTDVPTQKELEPVEAFTMVFEKSTDKTFNLVMAWDDVRATLPISQ